MQQRLAEEMVASAEQLVSLNEQRIKVGRGDEFQAALSRANVATFRDSVEQFKLARAPGVASARSATGPLPVGERRRSARACEAAGAGTGGVAVRAARAPAGRGRGEPARRGSVLRRLGSEGGAPADDFTDGFGQRHSRASSSCCRIARTRYGARARSCLLPIFTGGALKTAGADSHRRAAPGDRGLRAHRRTRIRRGRERTLGGVRRGTTRGNPRVRRRRRTREPWTSRRSATKSGPATCSAVQQQQLAVQGSRSAAVRMQTERLIQRVNLYLALGGGFDTAAAVAESGEHP